MQKLIKIAAAALMGLTMMTVPMNTFAAETEAAEHERDFDEAVVIALQDAGLTEDEVTFSKKMNEFKNGTEVYEIDFMIPSEMKYEYEINAMTGEVTAREIEPWEAEDDIGFRALLNEKTDCFDFYSEHGAQVTAYAMLYSLQDSGLTDPDTRYYKTGVEYEDGAILVKVGLLVPGKVKYEYEFDGRSGDLVKIETEGWEAEDDLEFAELISDARENTRAGASYMIADAMDDTIAKAAVLN